MDTNQHVINPDVYYNKRKLKGNFLESLIDKWLDNQNINYLKTGYENYFHPVEVDLLKTQDWAISMRMVPDRYLPEQNIYLEICNSSAISRDKYDFQIKYDNCYVINRDLYVCKLKDLKFQKPNHKIWGFEIPIDDLYWRNPMKMDEQERYRLIQYADSIGKSQSAKSHAFFDWDNTKTIHIGKLLSNGKIIQ